MKMKLFNTSGSHNKKGISVGALIVCFLIACGIWLYAQAIDDDIKVTTYNQLPVEIVGADAFKEAIGYDVHSLNVQNANISISGINRELAKYDAQNIRLVADVSSTNNGVTSIKAYYIDDNGNKTELKNYEITPAVATVNVSKQVDYSVVDVTTDLNHEVFTYAVDNATVSGTFMIVGPEQDIKDIYSVTFEADYKNVKESEGTHKIPVTTASFYAEDGTLLFNDQNKNENVKYDVTGIEIIVTVSKIEQPENDK